MHREPLPASAWAARPGLCIGFSPALPARASASRSAASALPTRRR